MIELSQGQCFRGLLRFECCSALASSRQWLWMCSFFLLFVLILPMAYPQSIVLQQQWLPGVLWSGLILTAMLFFDRVFLQDWQSGLCDQWLLMRIPLRTLIQAKLIALWGFVLMPMCVIGCVVAIIMGMSFTVAGGLLLSFVLGVPAIITMGLLASALMLGIRGAHGLLPLMILPFIIPVVILGSGLVNALRSGEAISALIAMLIAICTLSICLGPSIIAAAMKLRRYG